MLTPQQQLQQQQESSSSNNNEKALMLVNLHDPDDREVMDVANMKKGRKYKLMAAILETMADQESGDGCFGNPVSYR